MDEQYQLYLGDALAILPTLEAGSVDVVITDPPYLGLRGGTGINGDGVAKRVRASLTIGDEWCANLNWVMPAWNICRFGAMVFTSYHAIDRIKQAFPPATAIGLVVWYKRNSPPPQNNVPHFNSEFIWLFKKTSGLNWRKLETFYDIPLLQAGCFAGERILRPDSGKAVHPTQKPEQLMRQLLRATRPGDIILDPFMGLGTTGVACLQLGRRFIGIEIREDYFKVAEKRLAQAARQMLLPLEIG